MIYYLPKPDHVIFKSIEPPHFSQRETSIILPNKTPAQNWGAILAWGENIDITDEFAFIIYHKFRAECIDEENKLYTTNMDGIICFVEKEET